jgi:hypothetical protein
MQVIPTRRHQAQDAANWADVSRSGARNSEVMILISCAIFNSVDLTPASRPLFLPARA